MRKIIVLSMISLDGVMQAPGGPEEDTSNDFKFGGWSAPFSDEIYDEKVKEELQPADYILGRKTFDIWVDYWPQHGDFWPGINEGKKYVFSRKLESADPKVLGWNNSEVIRNVEDVKKIKESEGADLHIWGSSELVQVLLENDLVDELRLKIHPITLGKGKKLFGNKSIPAAFTMTEHVVTTTGVIIATYERSGEVETGNAGA